MIVFNTYLVPNLDFIGQFCEPPEEVEAAIAEAMRQLAPGPGEWCTSRDLEALPTLGFPVGMREPAKTAKAAKIRILDQIVPDLWQLLHRLKSEQAEYPRRPFGVWHSQSFLHTLDRNQKRLQEDGLHLEKLRAQVKDTKGDVIAGIQALIRAEIATRSGTDAHLENRLRKKLVRWNLEGPPRQLVQRALCNFQTLAGTCRACVRASLFRVLWNGLPTSYRMKGLGRPVQTCLFGCTSAIDKIEHYAVCPILWSFYSLPPPSGLGLDMSLKSPLAFLGIAANLNVEQKTALATGVYAVCKTLQACRASPDLQPLMLLRLHAKNAGLAANDSRLPRV